MPSLITAHVTLKSFGPYHQSKFYDEPKLEGESASLVDDYTVDDFINDFCEIDGKLEVIRKTEVWTWTDA